jgi:hypothetical protein
MSELRDFDRMFRLDGKVALITGGEQPRTDSRRSALKSLQDRVDLGFTQRQHSSEQVQRKSSSPRERLEELRELTKRS